MSNISAFLNVYDELRLNLIGARYEFIPEHLRSWFEHLDETPGVAQLIQNLQHGLDLLEWYEAAKQTYLDPDGAKLRWPKERDKAVGMKLLLLRAFATEKIDVAEFGAMFIPSGESLNLNASAVMNQIFSPFAGELRRSLERHLSGIPASDRTVRLDHNTSEYREADEALEQVERALKGVNDYPDPEDKEQKIAEVAAARKLLTAIRIRPAAVWGLIGSGLTYLAATFLNTGLGQAAKLAWEKIGALIGPFLGI